jgi:hypothetical protein
MKKSILLIIVVIYFFSCTQKSDEIFSILINEHFFDFVDTTGYKSGKLILIPNDTTSIIKKKKIYILVDKNVQPSKGFYQSVIPELENNYLKEFQRLFLQDNDNIKFKIQPELIKTNRNIILVGGTYENYFDTLFAGMVTFSQPLISHDHAIIFCSIYVSPKSGYTNAILFRKNINVWQKIKSIEVERW